MKKEEKMKKSLKSLSPHWIAKTGQSGKKNGYSDRENDIKENSNMSPEKKS